MKHKTAIEKCIQMLADNPASGLADEFVAKARQELRALLLLAKLTVFAQGNLDREVDWDAHNAKVDRELARLRRLGVLPEKKP